jgi:hypothetical protein
MSAILARTAGVGPDDPRRVRRAAVAGGVSVTRVALSARLL